MSRSARVKRESSQSVHAKSSRPRNSTRKHSVADMFFCICGRKSDQRSRRHCRCEVLAGAARSYSLSQGFAEGASEFVKFVLERRAFTKFHDFLGKIRSV